MDQSGLDAQIENMEYRLQAVTERLNFLKSALSDVVTDGIRTNVEKLDLKEGDVVLFSLPQEMTFDEHFFNNIQPIFQEKNVSVIVMHKDISTKIIRCPVCESNKTEDIQ